MLSLDQQIKKDRETNRQNHYRSNYNHGILCQDVRIITIIIIEMTGRDDRSRNQQQQNSKTCLKITQLHYAVTKQQLQLICEKYGQVKLCKIDWDKMGRSNETATVEYYRKEDAEKAEMEMNNMDLQGQKIEVSLMYPQRNPQKRHIIQKNYNNRYRNYGNKFNKR